MHLGEQSLQENHHPKPSLCVIGIRERRELKSQKIVCVRVCGNGMRKVIEPKHHEDGRIALNPRCIFPMNTTLHCTCICIDRKNILSTQKNDD